ncbi:hypothetical protein ACI3LY_000982 [Candidozyma auris]|uniref:Uncharacterized protein n=2 Tax=Candidozyma auris TaxID=498019 RepID=A0AB36WCG4_CANAR|nr:hypothetical protein CJI97_000076 [[Candida] auris]PIS58624.1 hypothetical protein B9J08_000070 [[Candida] auris]QWW22963.1 hypothetical protein CA7LBN_001764 [[Candida] auris]
MSSPSRSVIDPLIYSYPDTSSSSSSSSSNDRKKSTGKDQNQSQSQSSNQSQNESLPPASKLISNAQASAAPPPTTGWTPLVSRTLSTEMMSHNSTPNTKMLPSFYKQANTSGGLPSSSDMDYPILNLTPFLTHNLNFLSTQNSAGNISNNVNFTPFYDKSMHLTDFFIDSPLRPSPSKAVETITPSRFATSSERKSITNTLDAKTSSKRSIGQIDTPARHPFKKYDSQANSEPGSDDEDDKKNDDAYEGNFVTPSKKNILKETSSNLLNKASLNSTPLASKKNKNVYRTPAKPTQMSSPSTVIMSSANNTPNDQPVKNAIVPPSPTPNKERSEGTTAINSEPVMGIFSEKKSQPKVSEPPKQAHKKNSKKNYGGTSKFQIVFTDVHTLMNSKKKKDTEIKASKGKKSQEKTSNSGQSSKTKVNTQQKLSQKSQKPNQALRQQVEHTSHQLKQHPSINQASPHLQQPNPHHQPPPTFAFQHTSSSLSASQDYNTTMNSSKEFSMLGVNSSQNTTGGNLNFSATEHTSFELTNTGMASTPNRKYLLDNSFDKASPQAIHQMTSSFHQVHVRQGDEQGMPPPKHMTLQHAAQQALRNPEQIQNPQMGMNMMMSTPQHSNTQPNSFIVEESPSSREPMALLYQHLHQYEQAMQSSESAEQNRDLVGNVR